MESAQYKKFNIEIIDLLREITANLNNVFTPIVNSYGLTLVQAQILREISYHEDITIGNLGKVMNIHGGNISATCKQLEKKGFIERRRGSSDERVVKLSLTDKGIDTIEKIDEVLDKKYKDFHKKNIDKINDIIQSLETLNEILLLMDKM